MGEMNVVLITGVSPGIGRAGRQRNSLGAGFKVFGTTRRPIESNGQLKKVEVIPLDVRNEESVRSCVQTVLDRVGCIDALINNAGYTQVIGQIIQYRGQFHAYLSNTLS